MTSFPQEQSPRWRRAGIGWAAAMSVIGSLLIAPSMAVAQDPTTDPLVVADQGARFGRAWSESTRGGGLAWSESYFLESYMTMYETTGDRAWLDKIVDHTDRMLASAVDIDGDGNLGWPDFSYAANHVSNEHLQIEGAHDSTANLLVNGSFEVDADADDVPDSWTVTGGAGDSYRSTATGDAFEGSAGAIVESDGIQNPDNALVQDVAVVPGQPYVVSGYVGVETEKTQARISVLDVGTGNEISYVRVHLVGYQRYSFNISAPSSGQIQVRLSLESDTATGYKARFDDVSLKPLRHAPLRNGGMETLDAVDATLPAGWTRWQATSADIAVTTTGSASGANSLAITTDGNGWMEARQAIDYFPGETYTVSFAGKNSSSAASGKVLVWNQTDNTVLADELVTATTWTAGSLEFTAPSVAGKNLMVVLTQSDWRPVGFTASFDDVFVLSHEARSEELVVNRSFEDAAPGDATLPAGWTRLSGTSASDSLRVEAGPGNVYNGYGVVAEGSSKGMFQDVATKPGDPYYLSFWGRSDDLTTPGVVRVLDSSNATIASVAIGNTTTAQYGLNFVAPSSGGVRIVMSTAPSAVGKSYFDVFSLKAVDRSEPDGWTRSSTTGRDAAYRSTDSSVFGDGAGMMLVRGSSTPLVTQPLLNYKAGVQYGISFQASVSAGGQGQVTLFDKTTSTAVRTVTVSNQGGVAFFTELFDMPAAGHDLELRVSVTSGAPGTTLNVDRFRVGQSWEQQVHDAVIANPVLTFVNAVLADSSLQSAYLAKAEEYRAFVADNLVDKWDPYWHQIAGTDGANNGRGVYTFPPGFSTEYAPARSLPANMYMAYARMLYLLHDATDGVSEYSAERPGYWSRANDLSRSFKSTVIAHPKNTELSTDAYVWGYWEYLGPWDDGHYAISLYDYEDTGHAMLTMQGMLAAYEHGQVFDATDLQRFTRTFTDVMWNQSLTDPIVSYANDRRPVSSSDRMYQTQLSYYAELAEYTPLVWDIANAVCNLDPCGTELTSLVSKWSPNKLHSGNFEVADPADPTLPAGWTRFSSTSSTVSRVTTGAGLNSAAVSVTSGGSTAHGLEQQIVAYEPNTEYTISFLGKRVDSLDGRVQLYDYTANQVIEETTFSNTSWGRHSFTAVTPAAGHDIRVVLLTASASPSGKTVLFDDVRALPTAAFGETANMGFETADRWDSTLPRWWQRGSGTVAANAVIDTAQLANGLRSAKIVSQANGVGQQLSYSWTGYTPGKTYTVSFDAKATGSSGGRLQIIDTTSNTVLVSVASSGSGWNHYSDTFVVPTAYDHVLKVVITNDDPNAAGTAWFDNIMTDR